MENETLVQTEETQELPVENDKKNKGKIVAGIIIAAVIAFIIWYLCVAHFYKTHFLPNTSINKYDCSKLTLSEAINMVELERNEFEISIEGRLNGDSDTIGTVGALNADDIGFQYAGTNDKINKLLSDQNRFLWLFAYFGNNHYAAELEYNYDSEKMKESLYALEAFANSDTYKPVDAAVVGYDQELKQYVISAEEEGAQIKKEKAYKSVLKALEAKESKVSLEDNNCYEKAEIRSTDHRLTKITNTANKWLSANISYDWHGVDVTVDADLISEWIKVEGGKAVLDEEAVAAFITKTTETYDLYGLDRTFHTMLGADITINSKKYGWKTDYEAEIPLLIEDIYEGRTVSREPVYLIEGYIRGENDIGNSYVEADLTNQHLYLVIDGNVQMETDLVSGTLASTKDCVTPAGVFGITYKKSPAILRGADYTSHVSYWMPFYKNYGLHDATWRSKFGGTIYKRSGSHGCINLPKAAAKEIYEAVEAGFPVIVYYYKDGELPENPEHEE